MQNRAGKFIEPTLDSTRAAAPPSLPAVDQCWQSVSLLNAPSPDSYTIASFSYLLLYKELGTNPNIDHTKAKALVDYTSFFLYIIR